jgi:hypothetical protein
MLHERWQTHQDEEYPKNPGVLHLDRRYICAHASLEHRLADWELQRALPYFAQILGEVCS